MKRILGSWSGMRRYLEKEMLTPALAGRVRYHCTRYVGMDGSHIFELYIDGVKVKCFSLETVNSYFIQSGKKENNTPFGSAEYWRGFWLTLEHNPMADRTEYTDAEFCAALVQYRNQEIKISLQSENPLVVMLALLDRRVGKRSLQIMKADMSHMPAWLQDIYQLRIGATKSAKSLI